MNNDNNSEETNLDTEASKENFEIQAKPVDNVIIKMIGDNITLCQVVQLLAYIRNAIQHKTPTKIEVNIGSKLADGQLLFSVNDQEIRDLVAQNYIEIN